YYYKLFREKVKCILYQYIDWQLTTMYQIEWQNILCSCTIKTKIDKDIFKKLTSVTGQPPISPKGQTPVTSPPHL
ncbi:MAG: hypothetical protein ACLRX7_00745, partial [Acutalibacteraceae bacterium]